MKTGKELLELAAKAAGVSGVIIETPTPYISCVEGEYGTYRKYMWNPLIEDGDALRLAVKLNIAFVFDFNLSSGESFIRAGVEVPNMIVERVLDNDRLAATRRAIVRAAAAIGGQL